MRNLRLVQHKPCAYTLIEFLVYISLSSFIFLLFLGFLNKSWMQILRINRAQNTHLELVLACDVLRRDLMSSSMYASDWDESSFIFKKQALNAKNQLVEEWFCWYVSDLGLMRADGNYDLIRKVWKKNGLSLICKSVKKIELKLQRDGNIVTGAQVLFWTKKALSGDAKLSEYPIYVSLRNRVCQ